MNSTVEAIKILREKYRLILEQLASEYHEVNNKSSKIYPIEEWLDDNAEVWGNRLVNMIMASDNQFRWDQGKLSAGWVGVVSSALKAEGLIDEPR